MGLSRAFGLLESDWYYRPWEVYTLLTYGFLHAPNNIMHILANMYGLWLFGSSVEARYGSREFLWFYLTSIVVGGLVWTLSENMAGEVGSMLGASAGVVAVMVLFALFISTSDDPLHVCVSDADVGACRAAHGFRRNGRDQSFGRRGIHGPSGRRSVCRCVQQARLATEPLAADPVEDAQTGPTTVVAGRSIRPTI